MKDLRINTIHKFNLELPVDYGTTISSDRTFGPIWKALKGTFPVNKLQKKRITRLIHNFKISDEKLIYDNQVCVPRRLVKEILRLAHDISSSGHFGYLKTLARLSSFHWKNKTQDVQAYCAGCITCQQYKDNRVKPYGDPQPIPFPERRWGSLAMDFITHLPPTAQGFNAITTIVDRFSRRVHFLPSRGTATAVDTANLFFSKIFGCTDCQIL